MNDVAFKDKKAPWMTATDKGWIGVDLDGTLAEYGEEWLPWNVFGKPIEPMVRRIREWLEEGMPVYIITARVFPFIPGITTNHALRQTSKCLVTGYEFQLGEMVRAIQNYTEEHVGTSLMPTCAKNYKMLQQWDDRAVQVVPNTGRTLAEEHAAVLSALRGKSQG